jgi:hypothetical protein
MGHYLAVIPFSYDGSAGDEETQRNEVCISDTVVVGKDTFPDLEGFKHFELLREEEGDPAEAIKERIDFKLIQLLPSFWMQSLNSLNNTNSMVLMVRMRL